MTVRILIIDDEPRWVEFARSDLEKYEVVAVPDAKSALAKLDTGPFDLVIVNSRRLDALEAIRQKYAKQIVVTTVQPTTQEAIRAYRLGAARYFAKSFGHRDLFKQVTEVIPAPTGAG